MENLKKTTQWFYVVNMAFNLTKYMYLKNKINKDTCTGKVILIKSPPWI